MIRDDTILLQRLDYTDAYWFFPGGAIEFGETIGPHRQPGAPARGEHPLVGVGGKVVRL